MPFADTIAHYSDRWTVLAEISREKWPDGFVCSKCGCQLFFPTRGKAGNITCLSCHKQFSLKATAARMNKQIAKLISLDRFKPHH